MSIIIAMIVIIIMITSRRHAKRYLVYSTRKHFLNFHIFNTETFQFIPSLVSKNWQILFRIFSDNFRKCLHFNDTLQPTKYIVRHFIIKFFDIEHMPFFSICSVKHTALKCTRSTIMLSTLSYS